MKAGILACGAGARFADAGWKVPKPLIKVGGSPLISRVLEGLFDGGAEEVVVLLNGLECFDSVEEYLHSRPDAERVRVRRRITRSSFETFRLLCQNLGKPPFVISAVDSLLSREAFRDFLDLRNYPVSCSLALAVTDFVHDLKPLWISLSQDGQVLGLGDQVSPKHYVTAGLYLVLDDLGIDGELAEFPALRDFLKHLAINKTTLWAKMIGRVLDIDTPGDVEAFEALPSSNDSESAVPSRTRLN